MSVGCVVSVAVPVIEEIIKHQSVLNKLVKSLKKCLCEPKSTSSGEEDDSVKETLIQEACDELEDLCKGKTEGERWTSKERAKWRKLAKRLVSLGYWIPEALKDTPWLTIAVTKRK
jgi:hypothetical protein